MSPFDPSSWPFDLSYLPDDIHLVGGSVRDQLLNRTSDCVDLDFVVSDGAITLAKQLARTYQAGFVVLDDVRQIARVVFPSLTVDIAQQQGPNLDADLLRRDFTINAIAYNPHHHQLIDPTGGQQDIQSKQLRMVSSQNLKADPLRILRAYRQAAQLNFAIEDETQSALKILAPSLQTVSIERVRSELDSLLCAPAGTAQLPAIYDAQLLQYCLPYFSQKTPQQIAAIDTAARELAKIGGFGELLNGWMKPVPVGCDRSWIKAAKLTQFLSGDPAIATQTLNQLTYSRSESQAIVTLIKLQPQLAQLHQRPFTRTEQFFFFKAAGETFPAAMLLAHAQRVSTDRLSSLIACFLNPDDPTAHPPILLSGQQLIETLALKPGPQIGKLLSLVEQAQAAGKIHNTKDAIDWVKSHLVSSQS